MMKIALDAMGGDHAPDVVVEGAILAVSSNDGTFGVVLTGPKDIVTAELSKYEYPKDLIEIVDAPDIVSMDESPASVLKTKSNSGLVRSVSLQKEGYVQASVSAGNSGAMMAACLMLLGRIGGVARPAITCVLPGMNEKVVLLDCGANVDEKAQHLLDWAICGSVYAEAVLGHENPRVGLLNIGEEEKKGPEVIQEAHQLLKKAELNFIGNVEGGEFLQGKAQVVVTPGYAGNILLKLMEGFAGVATKTFENVDTPASKKFFEEWDYDNYGGAFLLGLNGTGIIAHGRANSKAIAQAVRTAYDFARSEVSTKIAKKLSKA